MPKPPPSLPAPGPVEQFVLPNTSAAFDAPAFDRAIRSHGVRFVHHRGLANPVGLVDADDTRRPGPDHSGASNSMQYIKAGTIAALFTGQSKSLQANTQGWIDAGVAQITPARFYVDCAAGCAPEPVYLQPLDRLYLEEAGILVPTQERIEANQTGRDRLRFPVVHVELLVDANNAHYRQGVDFTVTEAGELVWGPRRPGVQADGRGTIYSVRYRMRPFWYVERLVHEIRVAQAVDAYGRRKVIQMPQAAMVVRENVFRGEANDPQSPQTGRQNPAPATGGFAPR